MKKRLLYIIGILCLSLNSYAQKKEFKFGKIAPEEFNIKPFGQDTAAAAVKLFDVGDCYFEYNETNGFVFVFERHVRYKIINKNGYDLADFQVPLYKGSGNSSREDLSRMEAATYSMEGGKLVITKLAKDSKFTEEFNKNYQIKKYTLANVKEGCIIEYKYTIRSPFTFNLKGWAFQSEVPTVYSEYNVRIPEYLVYKPTFSGFYRVSQTKNETINANYVTGLNSNARYMQYVLENVPALKKEPFITTMDDYITSIDFELMATRYPNDIYRDYTGTWPKIIKSIAEDENFGGFVKRNSAAKSLLPTIIKSETDTLKIVGLIYNYVKNNIKWNDSHRMYSSETNPKTILDKKSGSSADINLILVNFLKEAKIEANPLLISTRSNGAHPGQPQISKFNNVLAHLKISGRDIILDATDKDHFLGMISYESLNHQGFSVDLKNQTGAWIATEPTFLDEKIYNYTLTLDKENKLKGTMLQYYKGYGALSLRNRYRSNANETEFVKNIKKNKQGLEIDSYKINNLDNFDEILSEELNVTIEENVEEAGNLVYLNPLLYERTKENFFKHETRNFPVDFAYPMKESIRTTIKFPDDYEIEKLPKGGVFKLPDNKGSFSISFLTQEKMVLVRSMIEINKSSYSPEDYFNIKELFKVIVERQAEQIVFKKKS